MFSKNTPYIALDKDYQVIYASDGLKEMYEGLFMPDFFRNLLSGYDTDSFSTAVEFNVGLSAYKDIRLIFTKDDQSIKCFPVQSHIYGENRHKSVHYRLREPLSSIFAILPIIADNVSKDNSEKAIANLETVNRQSYKLLKNINNISMVDRIMSGNLPSADAVDFSSLLENILVSTKAVQSNITIEYTIDKNVYITANKHLLASAVLNFISNSINFRSDENTEIKISLKANGNQAVFTYADNSIGIKEEHIENIFRPYYSKDPYADGENDPSLGLGLFIAKTAFQQCGGKILTSSVFGKGVKYIINIPVTESNGSVMESSSSEFLLNRYSDLFIQLCDSCHLPSLK